jgi:uncharacterized repeat protein (TIGR03943 family)
MGEPVAPLTPPLIQRAALGRAIALGLWALVLLRSVADGRLDLLLRAAFHPLVALAGLLLLGLAGLQLALGLQPEGATERLRPRQAWNLAATAVLAGMLLMLPPSPSFATLAGQRPPDRTAVTAPDAELSFTLPPAQRSLTDWVRLLRSQPDPRLFDGDPVRISGFVLPQPDAPPQLARLLVRCCLADAAPVGLPVRWPPATTPPQADQWLAIEGVMALEGPPGSEQLVVVPREVQVIPRPARPLEP